MILGRLRLQRSVEEACTYTETSHFLMLTTGGWKEQNQGLFFKHNVQVPFTNLYGGNTIGKPFPKTGVSPELLDKIDIL